MRLGVRARVEARIGAGVGLRVRARVGVGARARARLDARVRVPPLAADHQRRRLLQLLTTATYNYLLTTHYPPLSTSGLVVNFSHMKAAACSK